MEFNPFIAWFLPQEEEGMTDLLQRTLNSEETMPSSDFGYLTDVAYPGGELSEVVALGTAKTDPFGGTFDKAEFGYYLVRTDMNLTPDMVDLGLPTCANHFTTLAALQSSIAVAPEDGRIVVGTTGCDSASLMTLDADLTPDVPLL